MLRRAWLPSIQRCCPPRAALPVPKAKTDWPWNCCSNPSKCQWLKPKRPARGRLASTWWTTRWPLRRQLRGARRLGMPVVFLPFPIRWVAVPQPSHRCPFPGRLFNPLRRCARPLRLRSRHLTRRGRQQNRGNRLLPLLKRLRQGSRKRRCFPMVRPLLDATACAQSSFSGHARHRPRALRLQRILGLGSGPVGWRRRRCLRHRWGGPMAPRN